MRTGVGGEQGREGQISSIGLLSTLLSITPVRLTTSSRSMTSWCREKRASEGGTVDD